MATLRHCELRNRRHTKTRFHEPQQRQDVVDFVEPARALAHPRQRQVDEQPIPARLAYGYVVVTSQLGPGHAALAGERVVTSANSHERLK